MNNTIGRPFRRDYATSAFSNQISVHIGTQRMNDEIFSRLVADEVKNRISDSQRTYLELPENRERWKRALLALVRNLQQQIEEIKENQKLDIARYEGFGADGLLLISEATISYESRLSKVERFKMYVDKRLNHVASYDVNEDFSERVKFLESAISKHRDLMHDMDMEETELDLALWSALDGQWTFDDVTFD